MSEPDVSDLLTVAQAMAILDASPVKPRTRRVNLIEAIGLHVAQDVVADRDYSPFEKSLMDGYAIAAADARAEFQLIGEVRAGESTDRALAPGEAMAIMTGAPLPAGADGVVPIEFADRSNDRIRITKPTDFTRFVSHRGSDCAAGTVVI